MGILKKITAKKFSFHQIFYLVIAITSVRVIVEWTLFYFPIRINVFQDYARFYLENVYYFLILFLVGGAFLSRMTRNKLLTVMNFGVKIYPVIILPPLIDGLLLGRRQGYFYATARNFWGNFFTLAFWQGDASLGISLEIFLGLLFVSGYVFYITKNWIKSFFTFFILDLFLVILSTPELFFGHGRDDYYFNNFLPLYYFLPFIMFAGSFLFIYDKNKFWAILRNTRPVRTSVFLIAVFLGGWARYLTTGFVDLFTLTLGSSVVFFIWQVSVIVNDIYDIDIDRLHNVKRPLVCQAVTIAEYKFLASLLSFLALSAGLVISWKVFLLTVFVLGLALAYSLPPIRLRKNFLGHALIGVSLFAAYLMGIFSSAYTYVFKNNVLILGVLISLFGMGLTLAKDIKDIDGDKKEGVINMFTLFGKKNGKRVTSGFIFAILNIPSVMFAQVKIFLLSLVAVYLFQKYESIKAVYLIGAAVILLTVKQMFL